MPKSFESWKKIFTAKQFDLSKDLHFITANEIKAISGAEPRIMAKIDSSADLPDIFKSNGYFLLPVENGRYAIVRGSGFHELEKQSASGKHVSRIKFHLTTAARGMGEMQYLDYCFNSGALEKILGVAPLYLAVRGRERTKNFRFHVNSTELEVSSVQMEVDSGLEGEDSIILIEAKIAIPDDFIVRQLFYPYNHFRIVSPQKKIIPTFFSYDPKLKTYNFWIYEFADPMDYNSIRLKTKHSFEITTEHELTLNDLKPKGAVRYKDLVPQANDLNKVIELAFKVSEGLDYYKPIAQHFGFDTRQSSYYREAAEALGLVSSENGKYVLTDIGRHLVALPVEKRNLFVVELLSDFSLVKSGLDILKTRGSLSNIDLKNLISKQPNLSGSTIPRRASSLSAWFKWIARSTGSFIVDNGEFRKN